MKRLYLAVAALLSPWCLSADVPLVFAIKDARVVTVSGPELPKATVVLRDGLIENVGTGIPIPPDAWVIDGTGLTVYPGFIDALSTWGIPQPEHSANSRRSGSSPSATAPRPTPAPRAKGPEDRPQTYSAERAADMVEPSDSRLEIARAAGFTTAATFPDQGIFEGLGAMVNLAGDSGRDMMIAEPTGQKVAFRTAGFRAGFPNSLMGVIAYVRQVYLDLGQYQKAQKLYASHVNGVHRPLYDHDLEGLADSPRVLLPAMEAQQIDRVLNFGPELKMPYIIYGMHEGFRRIDELKQAKVPVLVSLKWPEKPKDEDPADVPDYRELEMRDQAPVVPMMLAKAKIKFAFYSGGLEKTADLKKAVKKSLDAGLSEADAIRALTLSPAEIYGLSDRMGSIDKGKIANLVVTKGDAFGDKTTVEYLFIDGKELKPSPEEEKKTPEKKEQSPKEASAASIMEGLH